jgi:predicted metal-dependent phosphoesterase TrpH
VIDLHSHTTHSDGDRSPDQLLGEAAAAGVSVLSVTDHDTVSGIAACRAASARVGVRLVAGIELSCELHGREVHILGHFLDENSAALGKLATELMG